MSQTTTLPSIEPLTASRALARPQTRATAYGAQRTIEALLAETGVDAARLSDRLQDDAAYDGLRYERKMAVACGLPYLRPLFVIGRHLFSGLDAASQIGSFLAAGALSR